MFCAAAAAANGNDCDYDDDVGDNVDVDNIPINEYRSSMQILRLI